MNYMDSEKIEILEKTKAKWLAVHVITSGATCFLAISLLAVSVPSIIKIGTALVFLIIQLYISGRVFSKERQLSLKIDQATRNRSNSIGSSDINAKYATGEPDPIINDPVLFYVPIILSFALLAALIVTGIARPHPFNVQIPEGIRISNQVNPADLNSGDIIKAINGVRTAIENADGTDGEAPLRRPSHWFITIVLILLTGGLAFSVYAVARNMQKNKWVAVTLLSGATLLSVGTLLALNVDSLTLFSKQINSYVGGFGNLVSVEACLPIGPFPDAGFQLSDSRAIELLGKAIAKLKSISPEEIGFVVVIGHADLRPLAPKSVTEYESNANLALSRARIVAERLQNEAGIPVGRILAVPSGALQLGVDAYVNGAGSDRSVEILVFYFPPVYKYQEGITRFFRRTYSE